MELKIGKRIQDLRKQKGLTQEQVAAALNISAAAVSKWETDTTYPDITILNPLARLLGVSADVLLDFQEQMTEEECMKRMEKADTLFSTRNWEEGQQYCEELLKEFPTDLFLKFRVASTYMQYAGASLQEEILKQQMERSITLFEESTASENAEISETAWYILSGLYCMNEEYEKGLEAVEKLPQPDFDARSMKSSILYQMGKLEESEKLTQRCLYEEIRNAGLSLVSLAKIAGEESEYEKAFRFLDAAQELETLFEESRLGGVNVMVSQMKLGILVKQGKKDQALSELKHLVMGYLNIVQGRKTETPIYFDKLEDYRDIESINYFEEFTESGLMTPEHMMKCLMLRSRDNARTPMQWDNTVNAGFTEGTPWIGVNKNCKEINVEQCLADQDSIFYYYQKLIQLRHEMPIITDGVYELLDKENESVYAYLRKGEKETLLVVGNFTDKTINYHIEEKVQAKKSRLLISNYNAAETFERDLSLEPYGACVYLLEAEK